MASYSPLFATSLARSGGNLLVQLLSANPQVMLASDPYLPYFKSLRNAMVKAASADPESQEFDPEGPIADHYFTESRRRVLEIVLKGELAVPFEPASWEKFLASSRSRAALDSGDLVTRLEGLRANDHQQMMDNALRIIGESRGAMDRKWLGFKEAWAVDFFPALARAYPDARFIVLLRDPRATICSMIEMVKEYPDQVAHVLSYTRHWRKYAAFACHLRDDPSFGTRIDVRRYEDLTQRPDEQARSICGFLGIDFHPDMLDTGKFMDHGTGALWKDNSGFGSGGAQAGIRAERAERWRTFLDPVIVEAIEYVAGPDLVLMGYELTFDHRGRLPRPEVLRFLTEDSISYNNWRTDFGDVQRDLGYEAFRRALLGSPDPPHDAQLLRRCLLFEELFEPLRSTGVA